MEKVVFKIPKDTNKIVKQNLIKTDVESNNNNNNNTISNKNASIKIFTHSEYTKITENVYKFNTANLNIENDIYLLYNEACDIKKYDKLNALNMFKKCKQLITEQVKDDIKYEIFINLALLTSDLLNSSDEIPKYYEEALKIYSDRAETYYYWAMYCNKIKNFEKSYDLLKKASLLSYDESNKKYPGTQITAYGKYLLDELSVSCYWLKKYEEGKELLEKIIDDPDFSSSRERLLKNLEFTNKCLENM